MTFEETIEFLQAILKSKNFELLNATEIQILKAAWEKETYNALADSLYLSVGHIKNVASLLWQNLSKAFEQRLTKDNIRFFLESEFLTLAHSCPQISTSHSEQFNNYKGYILIINDFTKSLLSLTNIFAKESYKVHTIIKNPIVFKTIQHLRPDIILLNITILNSEIYQLCQALRNDEVTSDIPIILFCPINQTSDKVQALKVGSADYITKPFHPEEVMIRIENHIRNYQVKQQLKVQIQHQQEITKIFEESQCLLINLLNNSLDAMAALQAIRNKTTLEIEDFYFLVANTVMEKLFLKQNENIIFESKYLFEQIEAGLFNYLVKVVETGNPLCQEISSKEGSFQPCYYILADKYQDGFCITIRELTK